MIASELNHGTSWRDLLVALCCIIVASACGACGGSSDADARAADGDTVVYAALGASDVVGVGATPLTNGYVYLIQQSLEAQTAKKVSLESLGIPAAQIDTVRDIEVEILKRSAQPDLITLSTGANDLIAGDAVASFEKGFRDVLIELRALAPSGVIAASNLPDLTKLPRFQEDPDRDVTEGRVQAFNAAIARQASAFNVLLVDLYSVPLQDSFVSEIDGFHPSDAGHQAMANAFLEVVTPYVQGMGARPPS
jgi:lysophospholipase L1-like esterase